MPAPKNNLNAEKWDLKQSSEIFDKAIALSEGEKYDFIGEIAKVLKISRNTFCYLSDKYPELKPKYELIISNLEASCFMHIKNESINVAAGIINLKSNHKWTDRQQVENTGSVQITSVPLTNDELTFFRETL